MATQIETRVFKWENVIEPESNAQWFEQAIDLAGAVSKMLDSDARFVEQREMQVCERGRLVKSNVASAFQTVDRASSNQDGEIHMIVNVWIAHAAAVQQ